jgi:hypothetical protein
VLAIDRPLLRAVEKRHRLRELRKHQQQIRDGASRFP